MTFLLKDPAALLDYEVDWGAQYLTDDALAESNWSVTPQEDGGVTVVGSRFDVLIASVKVAGGKPGRLYRLTNHVLTGRGLEDSRSIVLRVEKR